jgi:hypothetical protein
MLGEVLRAASTPFDVLIPSSLMVRPWCGSSTAPVRGCRVHIRASAEPAGRPPRSRGTPGFCARRGPCSRDAAAASASTRRGIWWATNSAYRWPSRKWTLEHGKLGLGCPAEGGLERPDLFRHISAREQVGEIGVAAVPVQVHHLYAPQGALRWPEGRASELPRRSDAAL